MMMFTAVLSALLLAASATFAQQIEILSPAQNQTVILGRPLVVTISQPFPIPSIPLEDVAITFGVEHCGATPCSLDSNNQILGQILMRSLFNPTLNASKPFDPPKQTFTITPTGEAGFATMHASVLILTGAGPIAQIVQQNVSIFLASA